MYGPDGGQMPPQMADVLVQYVNQIENELKIDVADVAELIEKDLLTYIGKQVDNAYINALTSIHAG